MTDPYTNEPLLDMFIFETTQLLEQLEQLILSSEKESGYTKDAINEIFRIMHTIKGSSAMMMFQNISTLAHSIEDLFFYLRECKPAYVDYSLVSDFVLGSVDFIKDELEKIKNNQEASGDASGLTDNLKEYLNYLKSDSCNEACNTEPETVSTNKQQYYISQQKVPPKNYFYSYKAVIYFEDGCEMENMRAYTVIHNLKDITEDIEYVPSDLMENDETIDIIRRDGFKITLKADYDYEKMHSFFSQTVFLKYFELELLECLQEEKASAEINTEKKEGFLNLDITNSRNNGLSNDLNKQDMEQNLKEPATTAGQQSIISVSVAKLDKLMDLVGEMVIAEAMVFQNPDLQGLVLENFSKAARQLNKITSEMQDMVMAIRMVPLFATFQKMNRIVRDMSKKLEKEVKLEIIGEETEVDKNIIEHISDPLMHLVRNAIDHGLESNEERERMGKAKIGTITLEAKNAGSDVLVIVRDDGKGLDKDKILQKAKENKLLYKDESEMSDKEIYSLILLPGFSTKDSVTEFSGRGVGMDVVAKNIESVGGSLIVDSIFEKGTSITLKIPLTLAIIDGMNIKVGNSFYTIPTISIKESFRPREKDIITDTEGNEMIMVRGMCYPILRLHERYKVNTDVVQFSEGIIIMVEQDERTICIFADELIGQQQVVVKSLPEYIHKIRKIKGIGGCTLLGDGSISLILDIGGLLD